MISAFFLCIDAFSGGLAHPEFGSSINPIPTKGGGQIMPTILLITPRIWKVNEIFAMAPWSYDGTNVIDENISSPLLYSLFSCRK